MIFVWPVQIGVYVCTTPRGTQYTKSGTRKNESHAGSVESQSKWNEKAQGDRGYKWSNLRPAAHVWSVTLITSPVILTFKWWHTWILKCIRLVFEGQFLHYLFSFINLLSRCCMSYTYTYVHTEEMQHMYTYIYVHTCIHTVLQCAYHSSTGSSRLPNRASQYFCALLYTIAYFPTVLLITNTCIHRKIV